MKKSIIHQFLDGERNAETLSIQLSEKQKQLLSKTTETYDELAKNLTPEQIKLLETFCSTREEGVVEEVDKYYIEGFKLGLLVGMECVNTYDI